MNTHTREILRAASAVNVEVDKLDETQERDFWDSIKRKFALKLDGQIWCQISFEHNKFDPQGWKLAGEFFSDWPVILFCDAYLNVPVFRFKSKKDLDSVLGESFHFVFYLASEDLSKLVSYDDHECLRAHGFGNLEK